MTVVVAPLPAPPISPVHERVVGSAPFLDPFPLLCAAVCIRDGRLKTVLHRRRPAIVLAETECLRRIWTIENELFWIPRRAADRIRINVERMRRSRRHRTPLQAPCWHGEPRPAGYRTVKVHSQFPTFGFLKALCGKYGYSWSAASAALAHTHVSWVRSDKRKKVCPSLSDTDEGRRFDSREIRDPAHPYVGALAKQTTVGGGFSRVQVVDAIRNHGWDTETSYALFEIFVGGKRTQKAAEERGLNVRTLYGYAHLIRKNIREKSSG